MMLIDISYATVGLWKTVATALACLGCGSDWVDDMILMAMLVSGERLSHEVMVFVYDDFGVLLEEDSLCLIGAVTQQVDATYFCFVFCPCRWIGVAGLRRQMEVMQICSPMVGGSWLQGFVWCLLPTFRLVMRWNFNGSVRVVVLSVKADGVDFGGGYCFDIPLCCRFS